MKLHKKKIKIIEALYEKKKKTITEVTLMKT